MASAVLFLWVSIWCKFQLGRFGSRADANGKCGPGCGAGLCVCVYEVGETSQSGECAFKIESVCKIDEMAVAVCDF